MIEPEGVGAAEVTHGRHLDEDDEDSARDVEHRRRQEARPQPVTAADLGQALADLGQHAGAGRDVVGAGPEARDTERRPDERQRVDREAGDRAEPGDDEAGQDRAGHLGARLEEADRAVGGLEGRGRHDEGTERDEGRVEERTGARRDGGEPGEQGNRRVTGGEGERHARHGRRPRQVGHDHDPVRGDAVGPHPADERAEQPRHHGAGEDDTELAAPRRSGRPPPTGQSG